MSNSIFLFGNENCSSAKKKNRIVEKSLEDLRGGTKIISFFFFPVNA